MRIQRLGYLGLGYLVGNGYLDSRCGPSTCYYFCDVTAQAPRTKTLTCHLALPLITTRNPTTASRLPAAPEPHPCTSSTYLSIDILHIAAADNQPQP